MKLAPAPASDSLRRDQPDRVKANGNSLRILNVIEGLDVGGAQSVLLGILRLANQDKFPMYVANLSRRPEDDLSERVRDWCHELTTVQTRALWDLRSVATLVKIIRRNRIDVVHTHLAGADVHGGVAAKITRTPVVSTFHSIYEERSRYRRSRQVLFDFASRHLADRFIAVSIEVGSSHVSALGLGHGRLEVIPNAPISSLLLPSGFSPARKREELGLDAGLLLCTASNLTATRDHATLLRALPTVLADYPGLSVVILGTGPLQHELVSLAKELDIDARVRFLGTRLDAVEIMAASDVFCQPTLFEGLPVAVLEAMALGLPVVASSVSGVCECIVNGSSGILVPPRDPGALADALCALLGSEERRRALGCAATNRVHKHFDAGEWIRRVEEVYVSLADYRMRS
jgi:glycosyltransferase involved in cell wall biosynthesis